MSGGFIPYHLRPGKAIDRKIFLESLQLLGRKYKIEDYVYVGFGGPFLEDFKAVHSDIFIKEMISLEEDSLIVERQKKNIPYSCISCRHQTSEDFIDNYDIEKNVVVWLDYASPSQLDAQFKEFYTLLTKLQDGDILKITLNANIETLGNPSKLGRKGVKTRRFANLKSKLSTYIPNKYNATDLNANSYPKILLESLFHASYLALKGKAGSTFYPISACGYSDTHRMLTLTGIIVSKQEEQAMVEQTGLLEWPFLYNINDISHIRVPTLSLKERLLIDTSMPSNDPLAVQELLGFQFHEDEAASLEMVENYLRYYRQYPQFSRIVI